MAPRPARLGPLLLVALCACGPSRRDGDHTYEDAFLDVDVKDRTCAVRRNGSLVCWGETTRDTPSVDTRPRDGAYVRVGQGSGCVYAQTASGELVLVASRPDCAAPPPGKQLAFSIGGEACAVGDDHALRCWSVRPSTFCVGTPTGSPSCGTVSPAPAREPFPGEPFRAVSVGGAGCAIRTDDTMRCWGVVTDGLTPGGTPLLAPAGHFRAVTVTHAFACAVDLTGVAQCFGEHPRADLAPPAGVLFTSVAAGGRHVCGVTTAGAVVCWGEPFRWYSWTYGPKAGVFVDVGVSSHHACARSATGTTHCWGGNQQGQVNGKAPSLLYRN